MTYRALFETGFYADCEWLINGKMYKLHSKIITQRSDFFKTYYANLEKMKKSDTVIEILDSYNKPIDSSYIDNVIKFLYDDVQFTINIYNTTINIYYTNINNLIAYLYIANILAMNELQQQVIVRTEQFLKYVLENFFSKNLLYKFQNKKFQKGLFRQIDNAGAKWQLSDVARWDSDYYLDHSEVLKNLLKEDKDKIYNRTQTHEIAENYRSEMLKLINAYKFVVIPNNLKVLKNKDYEYLCNFIDKSYHNVLLKMISDGE